MTSGVGNPTDANDRAIIDILIDAVDQAPYTKVTGILEGMATMGTSRKSSKVLLSHLVLDVFQMSDARNLVLTVCLYFEHLMLRRIAAGQGGKKKPLAIEIRQLESNGEIDKGLRDNMLAIVDLRNRFAHELYFDIADWNPSNAPLYVDRKLRTPKRRHLRAQKHLALVKMLLLHISNDISKALPWVLLEDVPSHRRRRSNKSFNPTARGFATRAAG